MSSQYVSVAKTTEVAPGQVRVYRVAGQRVALCNVDGRFYAVEDTCTHDDGPLGEGTLEGYAIECPRHGARFDVRTGEVLLMPAAFPIRIFETKVENGSVWVKVDQEQ